MSELKESANSGLDLTKRLTDIDDQRLVAIPDEVMVSEMVQRRYLADLRLKDKWNKKPKTIRRLRFKRNRA